MKKALLAITALFCIAVVSFAALDASRLQTAVLVERTEIAADTNQVFDAVDKMPFTGVAGVVVMLEANDGAEAEVKLQSSPTGTNDWTDIAGASTTVEGTNATVSTFAYDTTGGSRYIRASVTNSNETAPITVILNSYKP